MGNCLDLHLGVETNILERIQRERERERVGKKENLTLSFWLRFKERSRIEILISNLIFEIIGSLTREVRQI